MHPKTRYSWHGKSVVLDWPIGEFYHYCRIPDHHSSQHIAFHQIPERPRTAYETTIYTSGIQHAKVYIAGWGDGASWMCLNRRVAFICLRFDFWNRGDKTRCICLAGRFAESLPDGRGA